MQYQNVMTSFKCLSVSQPFAYLIISGKKKIELRSWNTNFRGDILIHAPLKIRKSDCRRLHVEGNLVTGAIVGKATLHDVKKYGTKREWIDDVRYHLASSVFSSKRYGFLLKNAKAFSIPIPCKGRLGLFDVQIGATGPNDVQIASDIFDEEYRTQWINHH
ncbi:MAG: ASCH domain-containing protein [Candidatus Nitrosotenuis sp.]|nr:ASCH domain-containing protein [Candidatus Nitrosotenuis uzonensis]